VDCIGTAAKGQNPEDLLIKQLADIVAQSKEKEGSEEGNQTASILSDNSPAISQQEPLSELQPDLSRSTRDKISVTYHTIGRQYMPLLFMK